MIGGEFVGDSYAGLVEMHQSGCVAIQLAPNFLLSAAHCGENSPLNFNEQEYEVNWAPLPNWSLFGDDLTLGSFLTTDPISGPAFKCDEGNQGLAMGDWLTIIARDESGQGWSRARAEVLHDEGELVLQAAGVGVCPGDSGSPVFMGSDSQLQLVGLVSSGPRGCDEGPIYVTSLRKHFGWLESETQIPIVCERVARPLDSEVDDEGAELDVKVEGSKISVAFDARSVESYRYTFLSISTSNEVLMNESFADPKAQLHYDLGGGKFIARVAIVDWAHRGEVQSFALKIEQPSTGCQVQSFGGGLIPPWYIAALLMFWAHRRTTTCQMSHEMRKLI